MHDTEVRSLDDAPLFDMTGPAHQEDPVSAVMAQAATSPLARTGFGAVVLDRDEVRRLLADRRLTSPLGGFMRMQGLAGGLAADLAGLFLLALDGEPHDRIRAVVARAFTPRSVTSHRPRMRHRAVVLTDGFSSTGRCEFVSEFADHYPIQVMCDLLGVPVGDHERIAAWVDDISWVVSFELGAHLGEVEAGMLALHEYVEALVAARRAEPTDDLVTALVRAQAELGELDALELSALVISLLFGGYDTTRNQLASAMWLFAEDPEQWEALRHGPQLAERAAEEALRRLGTALFTARMASEDITIGGYLVPAYTMVALSTVAANHDPGVYDDPTEFDITLERAPHLSFGGGPHHCLGAALARAEIQEALVALAARFDRIELDGEPEWRSVLGLYGPRVLPLRLTAATA